MAKNQSKGNVPDNIRKFQKPSNVSLGAILFLFIFIYIVVVVVIYFSTEHVVRYEVVEGALATNSIYRGVCVREEEIVSTPYAGYVNFLAREGQRVSVGDLVFTVDETGKLSDYLEAKALGENTLSDKELGEFRSEIVNYAHSYDDEKFSSLYDFKYSLKNTVLKLANTKLLENIDDAAAGSTIANGIRFCDAQDTGIITYWVDGYEDLKPTAVSKEVFDEKEYEKTNILSNQLRAENESVYKLSKSENWSVVFPVEEAVGNQLLQEGYIKVRFLKNQDESWGKVNLLHNADGTYLQLSFTNSMVTFASERFLDVELVLAEDTGLKIPISSITEKEFYMIDDSFIRETEVNGKTVYATNAQSYTEEGTRVQAEIYLDVYAHDEKQKVYYVDDAILKAGDILFGQDSMSTYVVKNKGTLLGVYNINKGFADFKWITILYENDEYAIVKSNTTYGLRVYDYIALDAKSVGDDQFVH